MRAFVTGGTGFVGAHLVRALVARGDEVTCLVRTPTKAQALGWRGVRIVRGDLDDARALREGAAGAEVVDDKPAALADAVSRALGSADQWKARRAAALAYARRFDWNVLLDGLMQSLGLRP